MNRITARDIYVVTATTGIGFATNVLSYSLKLPTAKGEGFKFVFPKGRELTYVIVIGFVAGIVVNKILNTIEDTVKTKEEKLLEEAVQKEKEKAQAGVVKNRSPFIQWV